MSKVTSSRTPRIYPRVDTSEPQPNLVLGGLLRCADDAKLIYSAITSLDGYVADEDGNFDWAAPDEEVHGFVNDLERSVGTYLYGRRMYEVMTAWESMPVTDQPASVRDFAEIWRATDKVVYSTTLPAVVSARTVIERAFDPEAIGRMKGWSERDISVGGPELAGHALEARLVDELHLFVTPVVVGGGHRALADDLHLALELLDHRRFGSGVVHLHYQVIDGALEREDA